MELINIWIPGGCGTEQYLFMTLPFFIENAYSGILLYWRNDTLSFGTWRNRLATAPDTPTCIVIHGGPLS